MRFGIKKFFKQLKVLGSVFSFRLQLMDRQEVYVLQEVTVLQLQPLRSPVLLAPLATALALAALRSVPAVHQGNLT